MTAAELFDRLRGRLVVSCQAYPDDPLHGPHFMSAMARAAVLGGAAGVRINGLADVEAVRAAVAVPLIGLWKDGGGEVYITPTAEHAVAVAHAGADVVALDATGRPRPDGLGLAETFERVHRTGALVMADVATLEEGLAAVDHGADCVSTTLSGYTPDSSPQDDPDLDLVAALAGKCRVPVFAEGRIATPAQAARALESGAHAVVVGGAITRPADITRRFASALKERRP
ncbi:N-acetylmannosamine-6-phosphate 2-epimerase [Nonomuraea deserti]|uniref:Putative N-acetylmannosamine-6-phosphate 2-epimerase n=1 Tax=Nonomuraea deserti TaxID=1848322 RepID=A0A4R4VPQ8_9ACTN|nr:N-acetylmannosamine-6-phosphate 2-epimerase [Nonomuraea deserti]TDD07732.1 N-acetylmannosamine-6-phosphate 2-epimerase [Nonomuraea deserti]